MADSKALRWLGFTGSMLLAAGGLASPMCAYLGLLLLIGAWWKLRPARDVKTVLWTLVIWSVPLALGPPLFSRDVYSYLAQGAMVVAGLDVYAVGPAALGGPLAAQVPAIWQDTPAPYGPVFVRVAAIVSEATGLDITAGVFGMRLIALLSLGVIAWCLPWLANACGADPAQALWMGALNPLVLLHLVAGAHNDALMLALLVAGLTAAVTRKHALGAVLITIAGLVKAPALLGLLAVGWLWSRHNASRPQPPPCEECARPGEDECARQEADGCAQQADGCARLKGVGCARQEGGWSLPEGARLVRWLPANPGREKQWRVGAVLGWVATAVVAVSTGVAVTVAVGGGIGWVSALDTPVSPGNWSLSGIAGRLTGNIGLWRWACLGVAVAGAAVVWVRRRWRSPVHALGLTLIALALLGPALRPWYLLWGLIPLAATIPARRWPAVLSAVLALAVFPHGYPPDAGELTLAVAGGVLGLAAIALTSRMMTARTIAAQAK